ncbi:MAG: hypothetical protein LBL96_03045, partial [Clostridiales bacterium]|nr:hypothetical protein [Clostridiales bacterium]
MYHSGEDDSSIPKTETNLESESTNDNPNSKDVVIPDTDEVTPKRTPTTEYITFNLSEYNYVPLALSDVYALLAEFADPETQEFPAEFAELISNKGELLYSSLTTDEKGILRSVLCLREDTMIPLERSGLNIIDSLVPGVIAQKIRITAPQVMELITISGGIEEAYHQADELNKYLYRYSVFNEDENLAALSKFLIAGFSADEAAESLVAALALSEPPLDTDDTTPVDINAAARLFIEKIVDSPLVRGSGSGSQLANSENTRLQSVIDILIENSGLSLEAANETIEKYKLNHNILYDGASPRNQTLSQKYPSAPFDIQKNINENINLNTGAIIYEDTLAVIPGMYTLGIDLEITMQYDLAQAYCVELSGIYTPSNGYRNVKKAKPTTINPMSYMGEGWALKFDRIMFVDLDKYLRFSDGSMFKIEGSALKNYKLSGVSFHTDNGTYYNSMYRLQLSDGRKEYFDGGGNLIAIKDRFGYDITFERYSGTYSNKIEISVSWSGRGLTINYTNNSAVFDFGSSGITGGGTITYNFYTQNFGSGTNRVLSSKVDQENLTTNYYFNTLTNTLWFSFWPPGITDYDSVTELHYKGLPLEKITYPNGLSTNYTYEAKEISLAYDFRQTNRVISRNDKIGSMVYNQQIFDYGDTNYGGWDDNDTSSVLDPDDLPTNYAYGVSVTNS